MFCPLLINHPANNLLNYLSAPHLLGGKDKQEGRAAVQRILAEYRWAKGKILTIS